MNEHRIICEVCSKQTTKGIIINDRGLRNRYFCSDKCLDKKDKEQRKESEEMNKPFWIKIKEIFGKKVNGE